MIPPTDHSDMFIHFVIASASHRSPRLVGHSSWLRDFVCGKKCDRKLQTSIDWSTTNETLQEPWIFRLIMYI